MNPDQQINDDVRFIETCIELQLLSDTDAQSLHSAAGQACGPVANEAVKRGLLTPTDVDIVQSLQYPRDIVPGYEILDLIGRGGMGVVYRARQLDLDRIVALKTILISNVSNPTVAARFEREAKALARLAHPNIVQAWNFGKHQGRYYFAMEFVSGRTCEQYVNDHGTMPAAQVWFLVRQVASGLMHALSQNLIHRDIKPANLILMAAPEGSPWPRGTEIAKITDFGLAMFTDTSPETMRLTTGDKIMGSPTYMSPEQFTSDGVDFRTDMYALGATAWHLLFGTPPYRGGNIAALFHEKMKPLAVDRETLPTVLSDDPWQLLLGLLDPDPDRRPPSYESLIDAIDRLDVDDAASTLPPMIQSSAAAAAGISEQPTAESPLPPGQPQIRSPRAMGEASGVTAQRPAAAPWSSPGTELDATQDITQPAAAGTSRRSRQLSAASILVVVIAVIGALLFAASRFLAPARGPRAYTRVVDTQPLFDGETLSGWDVGGAMVGAWKTMQAPDSSTAIGCTSRQGAMTRRIPEIDYPRINLFVWLLAGGGSVDIDFGFDSTDSTDVRGCLRISGGGNAVGIKTSDFSELDIVADSPVLPSLHNRYHVVRLERQPQDWFVYLEEQLVGTLPIERIGDGDAIRIVVHRSESEANADPCAFFADVRVDALARSNSAN
jgi:serine/threonine protein kinase